ncbi:MAG TPA: adenylate/guanylate cyclase domain-containing protein [Gaiellaceae bacterium]|nr:adenylate/guanylate cyclase domain-containing protein [Gaiellaceae bacterium]
MREPPGAAGDDVVRVAGTPEPDEVGHAEIQTFVIADVRGYTSFTQERGDEAAAALATVFAAIVRETVESMGGRLLELRGDEALSVFASARQAMRVSVELQERFVDHTVQHPAQPLRVGIGIDAGEAVSVEGGYRGGALNLAARLCSLAGPGQVLASAEAAHLARRVDGVEFIEHGTLAVKGLAHPVRVVRIVAAAGDAAARLPELDVATRTLGRWRHRRAGRVAAAAFLVALVAVVVLVRSRGDPTPVVAKPDSLAVVDEDEGRVVASVPVGGRPGQVVVSGDSAWVANSNDSTITRVDLDSRRTLQTIGLGYEPTGLAASDDAVWVVGGYDHRLSRIDVSDGRIRLNVRFEERIGPLRKGFERGRAGVAVGEGGVWVSHGIEVTLFEAGTGLVRKTVEAGGPWTSAIAVGEGSVWVAYTNQHLLREGQSVWSPSLDVVDVRTALRTARIPLLSDVYDLDVHDGFAWAALANADVTWRVRPRPPYVDRTIPSGDAPIAIALDRWLWAANQTDAVVTKIDVRTGERVSEVSIGGTLAGIASTGDELWVSVRQ